MVNTHRLGVKHTYSKGVLREYQTAVLLHIPEIYHLANDIKSMWCLLSHVILWLRHKAALPQAVLSHLKQLAKLRQVWSREY